MKHNSATGSALGMLLAPFLALAHLTIAFALVGPACSGHSVWVLHGVATAFFFAALFATYCAWRNARSFALVGSTVSRAQFCAWVGAFTGILFTAVIFTQWLTVWVLSPCAR